MSTTIISSPAMMRKDTLAGRPKGDDVESLRPLPRNFHAGRADWHARHRKPLHAARALRQQPLHVDDRNMTFEHHAVDNRRVAGDKTRRNPLRALKSGALSIVEDRYLSPELPADLRRPLFAASAAGIAVNDDVRCRHGQRRHTEYEQYGESAGQLHCPFLPAGATEAAWLLPALVPYAQQVRIPRNIASRDPLQRAVCHCRARMAFISSISRRCDSLISPHSLMICGSVSDASLHIRIAPE